MEQNSQQYNNDTVNYRIIHTMIYFIIIILLTKL